MCIFCYDNVNYKDKHRVYNTKARIEKYGILNSEDRHIFLGVNILQVSPKWAATFLNLTICFNAPLLDFFDQYAQFFFLKDVE